MALRTLLKYAAIALGVLVAVAVALAIVSAIVTLVWTAITAAVTLLVLAGIGYVTVKGALWLRSSGGEAPSTTAPEDDRDPVERLVDRYVDGELTEDELERRLDLVFGGPQPDEIDRELELERAKERS